jgi:hypothetical protein
MPFFGRGMLAFAGVQNVRSRAVSKDIDACIDDRYSFARRGNRRPSDYADVAGGTNSADRGMYRRGIAGYWLAADTPSLTTKSGMSIRRFDASAPDLPKCSASSSHRAQGTEDAAKTAVIVRDVRERGGEAVASYTSRFDGVTLNAEMLVSDDIDLFEAAERCKPTVREALNFAADRIETYHAQQKPQDHSFTDPAGLELGWRWTPVDAVGLTLRRRQLSSRC